MRGPPLTGSNLPTVASSGPDVNGAGGMGGAPGGARPLSVSPRGDVCVTGAGGSKDVGRTPPHPRPLSHLPQRGEGADRPTPPARPAGACPLSNLPQRGRGRRERARRDAPLQGRATTRVAPTGRSGGPHLPRPHPNPLPAGEGADRPAAGAPGGACACSFPQRRKGWLFPREGEGRRGGAEENKRGGLRPEAPSTSLFLARSRLCFAGPLALPWTVSGR